MNIDLLGAPPGLPLLTAVLEVADQFLLLRIDGDDWLISRLERLDRRIDVLELRIAVRMTCSLAVLAQDMEAIPQVVKLPLHAHMAHAKAVPLEFPCQSPCALTGPP